MADGVKPQELIQLCDMLDARFDEKISGTGTDDISKQRNFYSKALAAYYLIQEAGATEGEAVRASIDGVKDLTKKKCDRFNDFLQAKTSALNTAFETGVAKVKAVLAYTVLDTASEFNVIASPNDWAKMIKGATSSKNLSPTKQSYLDFWKGFKEYMENEGTVFRLCTPRPQHWCTLAVGRSKFHISLPTNTQLDQIRYELYISGNFSKKAFSLLEKRRETIDQSLGKLEWYELPDGEDCRIRLSRSGRTKNQEQWPDLHQWFKTQPENFYEVFSPIVKKLDL